MLSAGLLTALLCLYIFYKYLKNSEVKSKLGKLKTVPSLPLIGHAHKLGWAKEDFLPAIRSIWEKCGRDKFLLKIGTSNQVVITKPKDVETILSSNTQLEKNELYENYKDLTGESIITHEQKRWRHVKKVLSPAFSYKFLEGYLEIFRHEVDFLKADLMVKSDVEIDIFPIFYTRALQTICRAGMAFDFNVDINFQRYIEILDKAISLVNGRIFSMWKSIRFLYNLSVEGKEFKRTVEDLHNIKETIINVKRKELQDVITEIELGKKTIQQIIKNKKVITFMELLLLSKNSEGEMFSNKEITSELITLIFAGHETVATGAAFAAYCLANNPQVQEQAFDEQTAICSGDFNRPITMSDIHNMKYLDCIIKETLRLFGPGVYFGRRLTETTIMADGIELPAGTNILLLPVLSHRDPDVFPDPDKFDPSRFQHNHPNQYKYYPFSAGPRNCIGNKWGMLEIKFWIASILRSFVLIPAEGEPPKLIVEVVLKSMTGVKVRCKPRVSAE